jgi:hypothetical protein
MARTKDSNRYRITNTTLHNSIDKKVRGGSICLSDLGPSKGDNMKDKYWDGKTNTAIRYYFYSQKGLDLFNQFRYLLMLIFGVYVTMKLSNPVWLVVMFVVSCPILILIGYVAVHHVNKVMDWLNIEFATYWSRYQFDLQERQVKAMEEINEKTKG